MQASSRFGSKLIPQSATKVVMAAGLLLLLGPPNICPFLMPLCLAGVKAEGQAKATDSSESGTQTLDSVTRAMLAGVKAPSLLSAALSGAQQLDGIPASTAGLLLTGQKSKLHKIGMLSTERSALARLSVQFWCKECH